MIPSTPELTLALSLISLLCWGCWAATQKLAKGYRYELYYIDFALALVAGAAVAAFTLGMVDVNIPHYEGPVFTLIDNLMTTGKKNIAFAFGAGLVFNLANMLLVAAISVAGMATSFPISFGLSLIIAVTINYIRLHSGSPLALFGGAFVILAAVIASAVATALRGGSAPPAPAPGMRPGARLQQRNTGPTPLQGILLSVGSGLLMAAVQPLLRLSQAGEPEMQLSPYAVALCLAAGVLITSPVYCLVLMRIPVAGEELSLSHYFAARWSKHVLGFCGGLLWTCGLLAALAAHSAPAAAAVSAPLAPILASAFPVLAMLVGLFVFGEFKTAKGGAIATIFAALLLYVAGVAVIGFGG